MSEPRPQRILVPTDFSPTARAALDLAATLARGFDAQIHVLHVRVLLEDPHLEEEERAEVQRLLAASDGSAHAALGRDAAGRDGLAVTTHLVRGISATEAIVESCESLGCDLIVMGTHGRRGLTHALAGSVAEGVARTSPAPVLTVGPHALPPPEKIRSLLVAHDFSRHSEGAIRVAAVWANALAARVTLLHVVEPMIYPEFYAVDILPEKTLADVRTRSEDALREVADRLLVGIEHDVEVESGRAWERIVARATPPDYDLAIVGGQGLSALEHLLLGSVAENVLRRAHLPLLTVRPPR